MSERCIIDAMTKLFEGGIMLACNSKLFYLNVLLLLNACFLFLLQHIHVMLLFMMKNGEFRSMMTSALAELSWPTILNKRHIFREDFADFDPVAVSKLNEKILQVGVPLVPSYQCQSYKSFLRCNCVY